jgi:lipoprotein-releasing system ATP-binding protein
MSQPEFDHRKTIDVGLDLGLRVSDLRKSFTSPVGERVEVLKGIDFAAGPGEMVAITGPSGSGKSTLLHLLGGLEEPNHGSIRLDQVDIYPARASELTQIRSRNIGFIFQFHHLLADLSAAENVALPLLITRRSLSEALGRAASALEALGLKGKGLLPTGHLSGGEQQKVAVARALIGEPALVLADEPTGNLDSAQGEEIAELLHNYCRRHLAIVIVATHNLRLGQICDRLLGIRDGRLFSESSAPSEKTGPLPL